MPLFLTKHILQTGFEPYVLDSQKLPMLTRRPMVSWESYVYQALQAFSGPKYALVVLSSNGPGKHLHFHDADFAGMEQWARGLICPSCGQKTKPMRSGYLTNIYAYREGLCCNKPVYGLFSFRRHRLLCLGLMDPLAGRIYVAPGEYWRQEGTDWTFWAGILAFQRRTQRLLERFKAGWAIEPETEYSALIIGRGESNPGHLIFQDLATALETHADRPVVCTREAEWLLPMVREIFTEDGVSVSAETFADFTDRLDAEGRSGFIPEQMAGWPENRTGTPAQDTIISAFRKVAAQGQPLFADGRTVVLHIRTGSRRWTPVVENTLSVIRAVRCKERDVKFVIHIVADPEAKEVRRLAGAIEGIAGTALLLNPSICDLAANIINARVSAGPIGSAFWWPALADVSSVTLHPHGDRTNIVIYEWIAKPEDGSLPNYLRLLEKGRWIGLREKPRPIPRRPFDDIDVPVERVSRAILSLIE